jgi:uncharacterized protein (DUF433 family)
MDQRKSVHADNETRVISDPTVLGGQPVIRGTRVPVSLILNLLAHDYTIDRIVQAYPHLTVDSVKAAIRYAEVQVSSQPTPTLAKHS